MHKLLFIISFDISPSKKAFCNLLFGSFGVCLQRNLNHRSIDGATCKRFVRLHHENILQLNSDYRSRKYGMCASADCQERFVDSKAKRN
jgi:hypothetical protein